MRLWLPPLRLLLLLGLIPSTLYANQTAQTPPPTQLEPNLVNADLRKTKMQNMPASIELQTGSELQDEGLLHFDDLLLKTANVNFSGQSSRARHIQIRGIGQRDEYTGAPNSSVGFVIDDMDFSGIAMTANLFDIKQIEVLRGPQNIRFGQSAIAGLVDIQSNPPSEIQESMVETSLGQDNLKELGIMSSGPIGKGNRAPQYRVSLFKHNQDGFRQNTTLNRHDTNARNELTLRAKLRFFPNHNTQIDVTALHADLNNGYDAWSRTNTFTTQSNQPGKDTQLSNGLSIKTTLETPSNYTFTAKTSFVNSDMLYNYDEDWTSASNGIYLNKKNRRTLSQELRWVSTPQSRIANTADWLIGLYASKLDENNKTEYWGQSSSDYTQIKLAAFSQLDYHFTPKATLIIGLRVERNNSTFSNNANENDAPEDTLWGANFTYHYKYTPAYTAFASVTRGYKAGGFNAGQPANTATIYLKYHPETLINYEIGLKSHHPKLELKTNVTLFYMDRIDPQFDGYTYDPTAFSNWGFYTENLNNAQNIGLEADFNWQATPHLTTYGSLGLLQTSASGTPANTAFTINEREQAHAPTYQIQLGIKYRNHHGLYAQTDLTAVDQFYFDNVHNAQSKSYRLVNARIGYESQNYEVYLWGKNITDETYATRGYHFDFNAPYTNPTTYVRLGDPRQFGITFRVYF